MLTVAELERLKNTPLTEAAELVDIYRIAVDRNMPKLERAEQYLKEIKNPYLFRAGDMIVKIEPKGTVTLKDALGRILAG